MHNVLIGDCDERVSSLLQIRDVPDGARRGVKARAAARGRSLNAYILDVIDLSLIHI